MLCVFFCRGARELAVRTDRNLRKENESNHEDRPRIRAFESGNVTTNVQTRLIPEDVGHIPSQHRIAL